MQVWYNKDWFGKDKPTKQELITDWHFFFGVFVLSSLLTVILGVVSVVCPFLIGVEVLTLFVTMLWWDLQRNIKKTYFELYIKKRL